MHHTCALDQKPTITQYRNQTGRAATHSISTFAFRGKSATPTHVLAGGASSPKN